MRPATPPKDAPAPVERLHESTTVQPRAAQTASTRAMTEQEEAARDAAMDAADDAARGKAAPVLSAHRILLVEDNGINRVVAREMLRSLGHSVTEVHNGREAVDITLEQPFDLILMDISMPLMDGRTATRAIRASNGPPMPIRRLSRSPPMRWLTSNAPIFLTG